MSEIMVCSECQKLIKGNRHTPPHADLVLTNRNEFNSMMGSVNENYYNCNCCGQKWMHETGNYGEGWIKC